MTLDRAFVEHITRAPSQYDQCCRDLAADWLRMDAALSRAQAVLQEMSDRADADDTSTEMSDEIDYWMDKVREALR